MTALFLRGRVRAALANDVYALLASTMYLGNLNHLGAATSPKLRPSTALHFTRRRHTTHLPLMPEASHPRAGGSPAATPPVSDSLHDPHPGGVLSPLGLSSIQVPQVSPKKRRSGISPVRLLKSNRAETLRRQILAVAAAICGDRLHTIFQAGIALIHLALADDLAITSFEDEVFFVRIAGLLDLELRLIGRVLTHGLNAIFAAGFVLVTLAGKDDFTVFCLQSEVVFLGLLALIEFKHNWKVFGSDSLANRDSHR